MSHDSVPKLEYGSLKSYLLGLSLSIVLTLAAYFLVVEQLLTGWVLDISVALLAVAQALAQLFLFVQLNREARPRWNLMLFLFMLLVITIIVVGSLWIMNNLKYNLMRV